MDQLADLRFCYYRCLCNCLCILGDDHFSKPHYANQGGFPASAIRQGDYKLIQDLDDGAVELYNLKDDPEEHNNPEQLEVERAKEMLAALQAWRREIGARPLRKIPGTRATPPKVD